MGKQPETMVVVRADGVRGLAVIRMSDPSSLLVRWEDGKEETAPSAWLSPRGDGWYTLEQPGGEAAPREGAVQDIDVTVLPVVEERLNVARRAEEAGRVRVTKEVTKRDELVDEPVVHDVVQVERVPVGRAIDVMPEVRTEGDTTVVPVVEEQLVVEKRLVLKEEVRITKRRVVERPEPQRVELRQERVRVERASGEQRQPR